MSKEILFTIEDLDNPFEREKLESLPNYILVDLLIRHLKKEIKAIEYCNEVIKEHNDGEYNVSTTQLAIKEHKGNIENILEILEDKE